MKEEDFWDHEQRIKRLLMLLYGSPDSALPEDSFSESPKAHSDASELVMAISEAIAALVRNGVSPSTLKSRLFGVLLDEASPFPTLKDLLEFWVEDGFEDQQRLDELRCYNELVRSGAYKERQ